MMKNFTLKQISHQKNVDDYDVIINGEIFSNARLTSAKAMESKYGHRPTILKFDYYEDEQLKYQFNGALLDDFLIRDINNKVVGKITTSDPSVFALFQHFNYDISFKGHEYFVEEQINLNEGMKIKIFNEDDEEVAVIGKNRITVNYLDTYDIKIVDNMYFDLAALFTLYLDINRFNNFDDLLEDEVGHQLDKAIIADIQN